MDKKNRKNKIEEQQKAAGKQPPKRVSRKTLRRRKNIKRLISLVVSIIIIAICVVAALRLLFIVRTVEVNGTEVYSQKDITDFCGIEPKGNIFKVDVKLLSTALQENFKYIEAATVKRQLPDRVIINITDSIETYYKTENETITVYSQNFKPLRQSTEIPAGLIQLDLDMENPELLDIVMQICTIFETYEFNNINSLIITSASDIKAVYDNRITISFGTMLDMDYKIRMCKKVLEEKIPAEEQGTVDVTKGGEAVYRRQ